VALGLGLTGDGTVMSVLKVCVTGVVKFDFNYQIIPDCSIFFGYGFLFVRSALGSLRHVPTAPLTVSKWQRRGLNVRPCRVLA